MRPPQDTTKRKEGGKESKAAGPKAALHDLDELWDETQYDEEYDLNAFLDSLRK